MAKFYAVKTGKQPGVYTDWASCQEQVKGFPGAKFKSFASKEAAEHAVIHGWDSPAPAPKGQEQSQEPTRSDYIDESLSVDAACAGNPGKMEYQCVKTADNTPVFTSKIYPVGTNNIGEFLAVVDALRYLKDLNSPIPIYTDSRSALAWVRNQRVKTTLVRNEKTEELWQAIDDAIHWLNMNPYPNPILKWETERWGESKADFGRK